MVNDMVTKRAAIDMTWRMACRRLKERLPEATFSDWIEKYILLELSDDKAIIGYSSEASPELFETEYHDIVKESFKWASGREIKVEYRKVGKKAKKSQSEPRKKKRNWLRIILKTFLWLLISGAFILVMIVWKNAGEDRSFKETFYQIGSVKALDSIRILQLSDLHNTEYGDNNEVLIERIHELEPDLIVMTGDMLDRREDSSDIVLELCQAAVSVAPTYFIYGNNETAKAFGTKDMNLQSVDDLLDCTEDNRDPGRFYELDDDLRVMLESMGVNVLFNSEEELMIGEMTIDIFGVVTSSPGAFWEYAGETFSSFLTEDTDHFKLFLCHEPTILEMYNSERWGDLVLCGHTHGGVVRIPYIGGLYINSGGEHILFPEISNDLYDHYVAGMYELNGTPMIVNTGLTNKGPVRIGNQPELVVIDINRY